MRTEEEYRRILKLSATIKSHLAIERLTGIPRSTVRDCVKRFGDVAGFEMYLKNGGLKSLQNGQYFVDQIIACDVKRKAYAYLLGMYLGDGHISKADAHRVYLLRITCDKKYPGIIDQCIQAIQTILPENKVNTVPKIGCFDVTCYHGNWNTIIPQYGKGAKHTRKISLQAWQQAIVDEHPLEFFRGLYHSDGSRARNIVKGKDYPRYMFTNTSEDILQMFRNTCDQLRLHWTDKSDKRKHAVNLIFISRRADVDYLDRVVGAKC